MMRWASGGAFMATRNNRNRRKYPQVKGMEVGKLLDRADVQASLTKLNGQPHATRDRRAGNSASLGVNPRYTINAGQSEKYGNMAGCVSRRKTGYFAPHPQSGMRGGVTDATACDQIPGIRGRTSSTDRVMPDEEDERHLCPTARWTLVERCILAYGPRQARLPSTLPSLRCRQRGYGRNCDEGRRFIGGEREAREYFDRMPQRQNGNIATVRQMTRSGPRRASSGKAGHQSQMPDKAIIDEQTLKDSRRGSASAAPLPCLCQTICRPRRYDLYNEMAPSDAVSPKLRCLRRDWSQGAKAQDPA